jgi:hypothetical protein
MASLAILYKMLEEGSLNQANRIDYLPGMLQECSNLHAARVQPWRELSFLHISLPDAKCKVNFP